MEAAAAAADENSTTTAGIVADFVVSAAIQLAALLVYLQIHLIKICAVIINSLCAHLLTSLNQILSPESKIHSIHHYLNELEALATAYLDYCYEIYLLVMQSILIKLEDSIRFMEARKQERDSILPIESIHSYLNEFDTLAKAYLDYCVAKYCEIYPIVKRYVLIKSEDLIRYMEATKQDASVKFQDWKPAVAVCVTVAIGLIFVRLCCGRKSKTMKAPGRGGVTMRRSDFEGNTKEYFRSLRSRSRN